MGKVSNIIRGRPVCIMLHGGSIIELEQKIQEFKNFDVCWVSLGLFPVMERNILSKIARELDIVFDCASVPESRRPNYEVGVRFPRLERYLERPTPNLWITSHGIIRDCLNVFRPDFHKFDNKIFLVDDIFPARDIGKWMDVPNSATLLIATMLAGGASKIFIFGMDGYKGALEQGVFECYCPDDVKLERVDALGSQEDPGINRDTDMFERRFTSILESYRKLFGNVAPIYNVSPRTVYNVLPKLSYNEALKYF